MAEDLPEYLTCCFERDFGVILDEVTLTDEVDLIQACEHWGQRVDKELRAERPQVDHGRERHHGPPEPSQAPAGARPRHTTTPLFDEWQDPIDRVRQLQAEDEKQRLCAGVHGPRLQDPRCGFPGQKPTFYVLHLFSGHARRGDLAWWVDKVTQHQPFGVATIAFDAVHHAEKGDLTNENTFKFLLALLRSGRVLAVQAGPPCETWSVARHQALEGGGRAPRPLRSSSGAWEV